MAGKTLHVQVDMGAAVSILRGGIFSEDVPQGMQRPIAEVYVMINTLYRYTGGSHSESPSLQPYLDQIVQGMEHIIVRTSWVTRDRELSCHKRD